MMYWQALFFQTAFRFVHNESVCVLPKSNNERLDSHKRMILIKINGILLPSIQVGPMAKASAPGAGDSGFESRADLSRTDSG